MSGDMPIIVPYLMGLFCSRVIIPASVFCSVSSCSGANRTLFPNGFIV